MHVYHHIKAAGAEDLKKALASLARIEGTQARIMATEAELIALIEEANVATDEIAGDIEELLAREPNISDSTRDALTATVAKLKGVAAVVPEPEAPPA